MKKSIVSKILLAVMVLALLVSVLPMAAFAAEEPDYVLDAADLTKFAQGDKTDGETDVVGTDGYFTIHWSGKSRIDEKEPEDAWKFDDGFSCIKRINFGGSAAVGEELIKNAIEITTEGAAEIKIWWIQGGKGTEAKPFRQMCVFDAEYNELNRTAEETSENGKHVSTLSVSEAGTYYIATNTDGGGSNYLFKLEVTEKAAEAGIPAPVAGTAYLWGLQQNNLEGQPTLYFNGQKAGNYLGTTTEAEEAARVYVEQTEGGYYMYFMDGEAKKYINITTYTKNDGTLNKTQDIGDAPTCVYTWDAVRGTMVAYIEELDGTFYLGTYNIFNTISASDVSYIEDPSVIGVGQFPTTFYPVEENPATGDATPVFFLAAVAMMAMGAMLVLRKQKNW